MPFSFARFPRYPTAQALDIVRTIIKSSATPLSTQDIFKLAITQVPAGAPATATKKAIPLDSQDPPYPDHPIRSVRYLKKMILQDLLDRKEIEKVHTKRTLSAEEMRQRLATMTKAAQRAHANDAARNIDLWLWQIRTRPVVVPKVEEEKAAYGVEVGVGEDVSHLNRRRQRARELKVKLDVQWVRKLQRAKETPLTGEQVPPLPGTGMTPASRYAQNLKVLRRHDPSIVSIFDQFSHVCLYHHNGEKWEKKGFEGSMFLFEREAYPPYGFFILNRMGMEDYVLHMHPEDDMETHGDYLMYRRYPEFTSKRLAMAHPASNLPDSADRFTDAHGRNPTPTDVLTNWQVLLSKSRDKGRSETVGLWMFATDAREPMKTVLMRLHSYIRKVVPYPEEFRYGPDRPPPPPPNPNLKIDDVAGSSSTPSRSTVDRTASRASVQSPGLKGAVASTGGAGSELDKLFLKLVSPGSTSTPGLGAGTPSETPSSLNALFAAASAASPNNHPPSAAQVPTKGLALLDSIFASATPSSSSTSIAPSKSHKSYPSFSSSRASPFPGPPSAPPSTHLNLSSANQPQSDSSSPSDFYPEPHPDIHSPKPTSSTLPQILTQDVISALLGLPQSHSRASSVASSHRRYEGDVESSDNDPDDMSSAPGHLSVSSTAYNSDAGESLPSVNLPNGNHQRSGPHHVLGDVTPRPPARTFASSDSPTTAPPIAHSSSTSTITAASVGTTSSAAAPSPTQDARNLVPFHAESNLWPYPRAPVDDRDGDVVVLDFADTSVLSDLDALEKKRRSGKAKKSRKEKERDNQRERDAIEKGWDVPEKSTGDIEARQQQSRTPPNPQTAASIPSQPPTQPQVKAKVKAPLNGANGTSLQKATASAAIVAAVSSHTNGARQPPMERTAFVREVLTLIHTDTAFVDRLWQEYQSRA
ncbi:hypothetical protein FA95DRAFT_1574238 [Auriscalpium vulgare]|uniref:Uncharacterized protein n=1 Tax=Auriscalpium vulgare TaxID=40419 RepID=A0ACB8RLI1_9AGAM|nr:hypothetical protein FA95DRAFT_1574238 [Auriscalpium vulgare]